MPPMPRPAIRPVTLTPRLSRMRMIAMREQGDADQQADDADRRAERAADPPRRAGAVLDDAEDQLARPDRRLERGGDDEDDVDDAQQRGRRRGMLGDQLGRGHDDEEEAGLAPAPGRRSSRQCGSPVRARREQAAAERADAEQDEGDGDARRRARAAMLRLLPLSQAWVSATQRLEVSACCTVHAALSVSCGGALPRKAISPRSALDRYFVARGIASRAACPSPSLTASISAGWT